MVVPSRKCQLQGVIVGPINIPHLENVAEVRKLARVWPGMLFTEGIRRTGRENIGSLRRLVDVAYANQVGSMISDVGDFERHIRGNLSLQAHSPMGDVRSRDLRIDSHDGAWIHSRRWICTRQVTRAKVAEYRARVPLRRRRRREISYLDGSRPRSSTQRRARRNTWQSEAVV